MIKNIWTLTCEKAIQEEGNGKTSLISCFTSVAFKTYPTLMPPFSLASSWVGSDTGEIGTASCKVSQPDGTTTEIPIRDAFDIKEMVNLNFVINGFIATKPGVYTLQVIVSIDGKDYYGQKAEVVFKQV